jgi:hypothetical protein
VVVKAVLSLDLESDGGILYTNGIGILRRDPSGEKSQLHKGTLISHVVALGPQMPASATTLETTAGDPIPTR